MNEMESVEERKYLRVGIYLRLSKEDENIGESESIINQKTLLKWGLRY